MTKITNTSKAVLGINAKIDGKIRSVSLAPGETKDLDVVKTKVHAARLERGALKAAGGGSAPAKPADDTPAKTPAEVLAMFGDNEVPFMTAKAEATKLLGDITPGKKAEIIAALEELATKPE